MTYDKIPLSKINDRGSLVMETLRYSIMLKCVCDRLSLEDLDYKYLHIAVGLSS